MPVPVAIDFNNSVHSYLQDYAILASQADVNNQLLWNIAPKHHYLWHLAERAMFLNPRKGNTALDEDFMGKAKKLVQHGTASHIVPLKFAEKYLWAKHLLHTYGVA